MPGVKVEDGVLLPALEPPVARHQRVVLVGQAKAAALKLRHLGEDHALRPVAMAFVQFSSRWKCIVRAIGLPCLELFLKERGTLGLLLLIPCPVGHTLGVYLFAMVVVRRPACAKLPTYAGWAFPFCRMMPDYRARSHHLRLTAREGNSHGRNHRSVRRLDLFGCQTAYGISTPIVR